MILSISVVDPSWVPEPLSQVCLCIVYVFPFGKINGSLHMEKLCIEFSSVCGADILCWCVWTHVSGELSLCVSVHLSVQLSVHCTMVQQASIKYRVKF